MFDLKTKILVVDDMMTMRKIVKKTLMSFGFTDITEANDGSTAWPLLQEAAATAPFKLVISDWNMPGTSGVELLKLVRANAAISGTPFVLLTAETEMHQIQQAAALGVDGYVVKPFTPESLKSKLEEIWNNNNLNKSA
jgi:two-component system chemotaxis response regulator CheY